MRASLNVAQALRDILTLDTGGMIVNLDLSNNLLGNAGCKILARAVKSSISIVSLDVSSNCIGAEPMAYLFNELKNNYSLTELKVKTINGTNDNCISHEAVDALDNFLEGN